MSDALDDLVMLLDGPVGRLSDDELVVAVRQAELVRTKSRERSGRLLAELHGRGLSWPAIARLTSLGQTTAYDWAQPYLTSQDPE